MFSVAEIVRKNTATFYDFRNDERYSILPRITLMLIISVVIACVFKNAANDFLNGVIATQAILIGFGFSVMFSIGSSNLSIRSDESIEANLIKDRLDRLIVEIFYNISYFIFTAIISLILSLTLLFSFDLSTGIDKILLQLWSDLCSFGYHICYVMVLIRFAVKSLIASAFYFFLFESLFTFSRIVSRVFYIFEIKVRY